MILALILNIALIGCAVYAAVVLDSMQDAGMELPWVLYFLVFLGLCAAMQNIVAIIFRMKPTKENFLSTRIEGLLREDKERIRKAKERLEHD